MWTTLTASIARPVKFGLVGAFNTALGLAVIFGSKALFGFPDLEANALGYGVGLMASFALNRRWTFRHQGKLTAAAFRFGISFAAAYALNLAAVFGLRDWAGWNAYVAQAAGVFPYTAFLYLASAYYVFPQRRQSNASVRMPGSPTHPPRPDE